GSTHVDHLDRVRALPPRRVRRTDLRAGRTRRVMTTLPIGHVVGGRYTVRALLGAGGLGAVYEVEGPGGARPAGKAPLPRPASDALANKRFAREANAMQLLDHPNLVRALDQVVEGGRLYLVLELVRGPSLGAVLALGALAPRRTMVIARQILDGLAH